MSSVSPGSGGRLAGAPGRQAFSGATPFTPCLALRTETLLVNEGTELAPIYREVEIAVIELCFDYGGGFRVRPNDTRDRFLDLGPASDEPPVARDHDAERRACFLLESFGAMEISCLDECSTGPGSRADYVVRLDHDVHAHCSFSAYALPQLRNLGWKVEIAGDYPFKVVDGDAPWYAHVAPTAPADEEGDGAKAPSTDWFGLELGIEVEGRRINLLPALLELLERAPSSGSFDGIVPSGARCFALPTGDGRFVALPPERLRVLMRVLHDLYGDGDGDGDRSKVRFPETRAASLAPLDAAFPHDDGEGPKLTWDGHAGVRERARALATGPGAGGDAIIPKGLNATLRPYQEEGVRWVQHLVINGAGGILADDMGLGKTLQTIAALVALKEAGRLDDGPALVITPASLAFNWKRELEKFAPALKVLQVEGSNRRWLWERAARHDVVISTYPLLQRDEEIVAQKTFSLVILDEAQAIKNPRSLTHRVVKSVPARYRLCLSGTPVENSLTELWSMFDFLMPGLLGDGDWFRHRFALPIERFGNKERMRQLREHVAPYILRRTKEEVAKDLPPKTEIVRPIELRGKQRDLYEALRVAAHAEVRQTIARKGLGGSAIAILDALMKLRQVCCDPRLVKSEVAGDVRESAKLELLMEMLDQQLPRGRRVLIFSQFATMLGLIGQALRKRGIRYTELTGATGDRQKPVDAFQKGDVDVFLISLKAGGTGLNLTTADTVIHYDPWWNPAAQAQATDRAYRIGQTRPVFVYNLICAGSVEERMLGLQKRKQALANDLLGRGGGSLSAEDVDDLFAPLADAEA